MQHLWYNCLTAWRLGGAVTQRSAKPCRWVQLPQVPPSFGRVAELVDALDSKSGEP